jgi:hypothetical protein
MILQVAAGILIAAAIIAVIALGLVGLVDRDSSVQSFGGWLIGGGLIAGGVVIYMAA